MCSSDLPAGRKSFAEMANVHEEWIVELLGGLPRREHAELYRLLGRVKETVKDAVGETAGEGAT